MGALRIEECLPSYTYSDYVEWEGRWELIDGVPYAMSPMPAQKHQRVSQMIAGILYEALKDCKRCKAYLPVDWKVDENTVLQPDNLVICDEEYWNAYLIQTPTIIFEVISPSTSKKDRTLKYSIYESKGVKYYLIVEPTLNVCEVYELVNGEYKLKGAFDKGKFRFELDECSFEFSFDRLFE